MRFALTLSYNGSRYHGWQRQLNSITVQQEIEEKLEILCGRPVYLTGCGRTDSGVHAKHFVAHFDLNAELPDRCQFRLNGMLPPDIAIHNIQAVSQDFQARFKASRRDYSYHIHFAKDPFKFGYSWFKYELPDFELMNAAAKLLIGKKEFACFCKGPAPAGNYTCNVFEAAWVYNSKSAEFRIGADRFLRNMVRAIVGTLLEVGYQKRTLAEFEKLLESGQRSDAGNSVHACGLFLEKVTYPEGWL